MGRHWDLLQFDKADYNKLIRESLWSYKEALSFAANFILEKEDAFKADDWKDRLRVEYQRFDEQIYHWCKDSELLPFSKIGRFSNPLLEEEWRDQYASFDHEGEFVEAFITVDANAVYFRRDDFLKCLSSINVAVIDEFDNPANPKVKCEMDMRSSTKIKLVCQGIAIALWDNNPKLTIPEVASHPLLCENGKGNLYSEKARREWLSEVANRPDHTKKPRKKNP